jgi:hypothetical protein
VWKYYGRTYFRSFGDPKVRSEQRGFRCARDVPRARGDW